MVELDGDALLVFVSDSHIGGDPGCDGFESPERLEALFGELTGREGRVELVLAGDFFDFLQIGGVPEGEDRASLTVRRPEYRGMFAALRRFRRGEGKRVIYLPGNHDAEVWWNPAIRRTLREEELVDEFAFSYLAEIEVGEGSRRIVYCEHGNQLDPANAVEDYGDRLDTPLGHHVVTDFTRRVAPLGEIPGGLDLSEIKMVYPLVAIPRWILSRYFYAALSRAALYLLLPLLLAYVAYRAAAYAIASPRGLGFLASYEALPRVHWLFAEMAGFAVVVAVIFGVAFWAFRRAARRTLRLAGGGRGGYDPAAASRERIRDILRGRASLPMSAFGEPERIDVFVSGHTHLPSLEVLQDGERRRVVANSGCFLRQLQPVAPLTREPPVFVSRFVLTHVRVFARDGRLRVELWEHPKPAAQRLGRLERLLAAGRLPPQPDPEAGPRVRAAAAV
ncbi:hypothetical protein Rxyl_1312 [Rubrobacter xylanophilus DSM 9941]|uniref:Calcineurin-like phosphoesterase domain-containing protein n=1 Tax=Rubrobacter xylanophilus (strain DSM 9941 / JCM 11954 / NBRC 16129 / PRD-1) TaxID=266117 RepID=Q1AWF2_RUBXD|nr:metallophosphoesterase [Rubrobacter xylanophilus]ABG04276.1 hypothetical protein Rxyl_1312 [Rubrobacter xylanophilus DSM 9941]